MEISVVRLIPSSAWLLVLFALTQLLCLLFHSHRQSFAHHKHHKSTYSGRHLRVTPRLARSCFLSLSVSGPSNIGLCLLSYGSALTHTIAFKFPPFLLCLCLGALCSGSGSGALLLAVANGCPPVERRSMSDAVNYGVDRTGRDKESKGKIKRVAGGERLLAVEMK